jgi:hypothetical protein
MDREPTLLPTSTEEPSGAQARAWALPRPLTSLMQAFVLTSQNLTTPSLLTLQSSASLTGLKATFSIPARCPFSSVEKRTLGFSGFPKTYWSVDRPTSEPRGDPTGHHINAASTWRNNSQTRSVLSEEPVATRLPSGFQAIERRLSKRVL